jgi:hypothetical protein
LVKSSTLQAALQGSCRVQARTMQIATSASADVASLEARIWEPIRKRCGEWRLLLVTERRQACATAASDNSRGIRGIGRKRFRPAGRASTAPALARWRYGRHSGSTAAPHSQWPSWVDTVEKVPKCLLAIFSKETKLSHARQSMWHPGRCRSLL